MVHLTVVLFTHKKCGVLGDRVRSDVCDNGLIAGIFPWLEVAGARVGFKLVAMMCLFWAVLPADGSCVGTRDTAFIETGPKLSDCVHKYSEIVLRWRTDCL